MIITKICKYVYGIILISFTIYVLLDTFVISEAYTTVQSHQDTTANSNDKGKVIVNDASYQDEHIQITITTYREDDTNIYVADVVLDDPSYLKTAFAKSTYGKNIVDKTSNIALENQAILAINGDYYGVQEAGYVLKNGVIYRDKVKNHQEDLVIYKNGTFAVICENDVSIETLLKNDAYQILAFGPPLIEDGKISVSTTDEVGKSMNSNPRTAIGIINHHHYVFIVSDGRTSQSKGLSLYQLATFMDSLGCKMAYNLDGGGSSTMYFNGRIINQPTTNGNRIGERSVSDIVYIGY